MSQLCYALCYDKCTKTSALVSFSCHLDTASSHLRRDFQLRYFPHHLDLWECLGRDWLVIDVEGSNPLWAAPFPRKVVLSYIRKLAECKPAGKLPKNQHPPLFPPHLLDSKWVPWSKVMLCRTWMTLSPELTLCLHTSQWSTVTLSDKPNKPFPPVSCFWSLYLSW